MTASGRLLSTFLVVLLGALVGSDARAENVCANPGRSAVRDIDIVCLETAPLKEIEVGELPAVVVRQLTAPTQASQAPQADGLGAQRHVEHEMLALRYEVDDTLIFPDSVAQLQPADESIDAVYEVGPFDNLSVVVWRNSELSTSVIVRPDGRISVPLIEDLYVEGLTPSEIARKIEGKLGEFVQDPIVTVVVSGFSGTFAQQIRVVGGAAAPTAIPYRDNMRILDVMIAVGGISPFGDGNSAMILRGSGTDRRQIPLRLDDLLDDGDSTANIEVAPGDIVVIPEGFFDGDWRFTQSASVIQTFSDNIDRDPPGSEKAALITEIGPAWTLSVNTARIDAVLTSSTQIRQQLLHEEGTEIRGDVNATSTVELFDDFLFFDASAASSRQTLDTTSSGADEDQSQVSTVSFSPYISNRFGSFATSLLRVTFSQTLIDSSGVSDAGTISLSHSLSSGRDFSKFQWAVNTSASRSARSESGDTTEAQVTFNPRYQVTRTLAVTGSAGFQTRDDGDSANDISDPTWDVGFDWRPSRRTNLSLSYGQRDAEKSVSADARYEITPRTSVSLTYSEEFETAQERLEQDLAAISINPDTGQLVSGDGDDPFNQNTNPFSLDDESTRTRRLNVSFSHSKRRDSYSASVQAEDSRSNGSVDQKSVVATASWSREINPRTNLTVSGSVRRARFEDDDRTDTDVNFDTNISSQLYRDVSGFVSYSFSHRFSDAVSNEFTENSVQAGFSVNF